MTRKDYIAIAEALKIARQIGNWDANRNWKHIPSESAAIIGVMAAAEYIANAMQDDNPRFDREHFLAVVRGKKALNSRPARRS